MIRKIAWEKWVDPLNSNLNEVEWPGYESEIEPDNIELYDFSENNVATIKNMDEDFFKDLGKKIHAIKPLRVINTKMGLLTVTENAMAGNHFDFWTMHTNFPITEEIGIKICNCDGVDAFTPLTKYRCRIGFPKSGLFNITDVKLDIEKTICNIEKNKLEFDNNTVFSEEIQLNINSKVNELKSNGGYWGLYVLPNGRMEMIESDSLTESFKTKLNVLEESQKLIGGAIFRS
jgi:hypothetical protein